MLSNLTELKKTINFNYRDFEDGRTFTGDSLYCPKCGDFRRVYIQKKYMNWEYNKSKIDDFVGTTPMLLTMECVQCSSIFSVLIYEGADSINIAVFPNCNGGLSTPNTPDGVAYYLDQASKSKSVGANSAAIAMFRAALEQILYEQNYTTGMLGKKIADLEKDINEGNAPNWAIQLDTDFLRVIKNLGNLSIHANNGDVKKQSEFDNDLLAKLDAVFKMLLFVIYDEPFKKKFLLDALKCKEQSIK